MPWSLTPAGPTHQATTVRRRGPRGWESEGSHDVRHFGAQSHGLGTRCLRFAPPVARSGRKTRFPLLARLYGAGLVTRRVRPKGFRDASYISIPLSQALPGAAQHAAKRAGTLGIWVLVIR